MSEAIYDKKIAPELLRLAKVCRDTGMSFVAHVEYDPGEGALTAALEAHPSFATQLAYWAAKCNGNIDALLIQVIRYANEHGHSSMWLTQLGVPLKPTNDLGPRQSEAE